MWCFAGITGTRLAYIISMDTGQTKIYDTSNPYGNLCPNPNIKKEDSGHEKSNSEKIIEEENCYPGDIRSPELIGLREELWISKKA